MAQKRKVGGSKPALGDVLLKNKAAHEQWRKAIFDRANGATCTQAQMPFLPCEEVETKEETEVTETDGQWAVPKRLFYPKWGVPLGILRGIQRGSGGLSDSFQSKYAAVRRRSKSEKQNITRIVRTMDINFGKTVEDEADSEANPTAGAVKSDVMSSVSQRDVFQKTFHWISAKDLEDNTFDNKKLRYYKSKMHPCGSEADQSKSMDMHHADHRDTQMSIVGGNLRDVSVYDAGAQNKNESNNVGRTYTQSKSIYLGKLANSQFYTLSRKKLTTPVTSR